MSNLFKVTAFSLLTIAAFAGYSNFGIPVIKPAPPPEEEQLDLKGMTMDQFIALGERVYNGKGTCTLCHSAVGGRAPLLDTVATIANERLSDERYQGEAETAEAYLFESMVKPSAYVVAGFGKAGTGDTESPMPDVASSGIAMSDAEIKAVIAYLQDLAGEEVTVEIPADGGEISPPDEAAAETTASSDGKSVILEDPEAIIAKHACGACHKIADQAGVLGPDLMQIGASRDEAYLRRAILDPNADIPEGFQPNIMPNTYGEQLYAKELEVLVAYLVRLK